MNPYRQDEVEPGNRGKIQEGGLQHDGSLYYHTEREAVMTEAYDTISRGIQKYIDGPVQQHVQMGANERTA